MKKNILLLTLVLIACLAQYTVVLSQPVHRNELSNMHINAFAQDSLGYIWIATANGLCKSYGNGYDVFFNNEKDVHSIPSNNVTGLYVDSSSRIWISTVNGVCSMSKERSEFLRYTKNNPAQLEGFFLGFVQYQGKIFTYGYDGLYETDEKQNLLIPRLKVDRQVISGALVDAHHNLWVTNGMKLIKLNQSLKPVTTITMDKGDNVNCMINYGDYLLLGTEKGIKRLNLRTLKTDKDNFPSHIYTLQISRMQLIDSNHKILINTKNKGVLVYDLQNRSLSNSYNNISFADIPSVDITASLVDKEKNMWFGTFDRGYVMLSGKKKIFNKNTELVNLFRNKFVTRITKDHYGNWWFGTRYEGIVCYTVAGKNVIKYNDSNTSWLSTFHSNFVQEIYCDRNNRLWFGYGNLLIVCQTTRTANLRLIKTYPSTGNVVTIAEDADGEIWVGTSDNGLFIYNSDLTLRQHITSPKTKGNNITKIIPVSDKHMLFSVYLDNIYTINTKTLETKPLNSDFETRWSNAVDMMLNKNQLLLIGTYGNGLLSYDLTKKFLIQYKELKHNDIIAISCDSYNNIWASSSYGVYRISTSTGTVNMYLQQNVAGENQYHEKCTFKDNSGHIYFGGNMGIEELIPENVESGKQTNPIYLTDFKLFGNSIFPKDGGIITKDVALTKSIELKHNQNVVSLEFASLCYDSQSLLEYAYILKGYEKNWNYIGKYNRATYANLPAGRYTFNVKVKNIDGIWGMPVKLLDVEVRPAPWLHPLALLVYSILLACILIIINKVYIRLKLNKERMKLAEEKIRQEHQMTLMKENFFTNISHELRTPLTLIYGPLKILREKYQTFTIPQVVSNLDFIANNADRLLKLTDQLLKFRNIKSETLPLKVSYQDCVQHLSDIVKLYNMYSAEKNLIIEFRCSYDSLTVMYDCDKLDKIMHNLLMNATKYTPDKGKIEVTLDLVTNLGEAVDGNEWQYMEIRVSDNGIGIDKKDFVRLFERFSRLINTSKCNEVSGFGIGLHYVSTLITNHKGKIRAEQNARKGMTFVVDIPISENAYNQEECLTEDSIYIPTDEILAYNLTDSKGTKKDTIDTFANSERKKILIVEDNLEMNTFMVKLFSDKFEVITAFNGVDGLECATEQAPDLIISDVLMPYMDGYELCHKIKEDKDICHIPLILLTAKTMDEDTVKGYNQGADMYLNKPFSPAVLVSIVQQLLARQEKLKAILIAACGTNDSVPSVEVQPEFSPLDLRFLSKLYQYIDDNISNCELNVNLLGRELGYSRTNFYRKIKALAGVTPNDLLKAYRLNRAAELIMQREYTLAEVSEMTGFGTQSYFSNLFKKHFGISPKDYYSNQLQK